ncbi:hypothetical protein ILYODFUR_026476 [Ilyodon furcidens]|uniref:Ig-like domain-containing protein n=1 Tax=Ilyodon furcidens TaxID=33524 RepID=A0ABV0VIU3_9TELE
MRFILKVPEKAGPPPAGGTIKEPVQIRSGNRSGPCGEGGVGLLVAPQLSCLVLKFTPVDERVASLHLWVDGYHEAKRAVAQAVAEEKTLAREEFSEAMEKDYQSASEQFCYKDRYFFRVENGPFIATACDDSLQINVTDSPWSPSINISGDDLKEHQSVTITCSALTPCPHSPPELTWNLQQDSHRQTEKNTDGTFTTKIQENITLSDTHDGYNIRCSARYPVNGGNKTAETNVTLSVSYAPRNTSASIRPSGLVSAGSWVELNCSQPSLLSTSCGSTTT